MGSVHGGTGVNSPTPVRVRDASGVGYLEDVIAVFAGSQHTLAITGDGKLWAWGYNQFGQLGNDTILTGAASDTNISYSTTPVRVKGGESGDEFLENISEVFASSGWTVAIKNGGTLWAWGSNSEGQLGNGENNNRYSTPVQVKDENGDGLEDVIAVSGGNNHTIALKRNGTVWAWGYNYFGQLGDGTTTRRNSPVKLGEASDLIRVAGGYNHSAALRRSGIVWTWGSNNTGQLGDGTNNNRSKPGVVRWK